MLTRSLTKRQLGILLLAAGIIGFAGVIGIDLVDVGREGGIGPAQRIALGLMVMLVLIGVTLLPLKDTLA